ncbi:hypothetical protein EQP59_09965 [Ornithobacterium rhinotracheale]|uniref:Glycerophosphoryl diester phosphodiesterase membrane domain-containing protein n=1 Tax=Ornithobacterium rhinotracheale TaxID=28251 RepID=A0A410JTX0_ORNRH|nr:hypothetical protein [Ornithobacterium rhinotracheale]QAR31644.1 hypothetical protein EQP59_09965 [Ornithobacterium rhinotracheale]
MIFYKKRNLGELISDSLGFFKEYGKNFLKNYIALSGGVIILILVIFFFILKDIPLGLLISSGSSDFFYTYITENVGLFIIAGLSILALLFILSCIIYALPILYMQTASEQNRKDFSVQEIFDVFKGKLGRIATYFIIAFLLAIPIGFVLILILALLMAPASLFMGDSFILNAIGFLLVVAILLLFGVSLLLISTLSFNNYILTDMGFFQSIGKAFSITFSKNFKKYFLSVFLSYLIIYTIQLAVGIIVGIIVGVIAMAGISNETANSTLMAPLAIIITVITYVLSFILSLFLSNLSYINIGLIYYDSREDLHREVFFDEIDTIGSNA